METIEARRIQHLFTRALSSYDSNADAQHRISRKLADLLPRYIGTHYDSVLEIGCGTGGFTSCLKDRCNIATWTLNDLCEACREKVEMQFPDLRLRFIPGDAEQVSFPGKFDLIASASAFQWMKQPAPFLHKLSGLLMPKGTLLFSTFASGNLNEIKELTGKGLTYPTTCQLSEWLRTDFHLLHAEEEEIVLTFGNPLDVLRHLKATGVTATGNGNWTRGMQEEFCRRYTTLFSNNNKQVTLTYRPLYLLAVKK